jgi:adenylate kinase family enzyme
MAPPIVLIGPVCAGKSTQANLLAAALHWPRASLDDLIWRYCAESGYSREEFDRVRASDGVAARRPLPGLFAAAVARIVAEHPDHVVDLGAGHTHLNEPMLRARLRDALAPCPNVVLLLPSPDVDRTIHLLKERSMRARGHDWVRDGQDHTSQWVKQSPNEELATMTVYTGESTPEQTRDEILDRLA